MAVQFKGSDITGVIPGDTELQERELAINTKDGKLFTKVPAGNIIEIGAANINTGLEASTPTGGIHEGHRYINGTDSANYAVLGVDATDLSYSGGVATGIGASGIGSFTVGIDAAATALNSIAIGSTSNASGADSISIGSDSLSSGVSSFAIGDSTQASGDGSITLGNGNLNSAVNGLALGDLNNSSIINDTLVGHGLISGGAIAGSTVIGYYNTTDGTNAFTIGDGTGAGTRSNILKLKTNGVMVLEKVIQFSDITAAGANAVVTVAYLNDTNANDVVRSVNTKTGVVTLLTDHIAQGTDVTRRWMTDTEKTTIANNTALANSKEKHIPGATADNGKFLSLAISGDGAQSTYTWAPIDGAAVSLDIIDLTDVSAYNLTLDGAKILQLQGIKGSTTTGDSFWVSLDRNMPEFDLLPIGTSTAGQYELGIDPYNWGINLSTQTELDNLFTNAGIPDTLPASTNLKTVFVGSVVVPEPGFYDTIVQSYLEDTAINLPYVNTTSLLTAVNVQAAIDEVVVDIGTNSGLIATNITNIGTNTTSIGTLASLNTTAQTDLVSSINEVILESQSITYRTDTAVGTLAVNEYSFSDTVAVGAFTLTLPASAGLIIGDTIRILDATGNFATLNVTLAPNGTDTIMGVNASTALATANKEYKVIWTGTDWRLI